MAHYLAVGPVATPMPQIKFEPYDPARQKNPMWYVDDAQKQRHTRAPALVDYKVCLVTVCSFMFVFHSNEQLALCLNFYRREHHPSSRLPVNPSVELYDRLQLLFIRALGASAVARPGLHRHQILSGGNNLIQLAAVERLASLVDAVPMLDSRFEKTRIGAKQDCFPACDNHKFAAPAPAHPSSGKAYLSAGHAKYCWPFPSCPPTSHRSKGIPGEMPLAGNKRSR